MKPTCPLKVKACGIAKCRRQVRPMTSQANLKFENIFFHNIDTQPAKPIGRYGYGVRVNAILLKRTIRKKKVSRR
jgi:hypothetical protein